MELTKLGKMMVAGHRGDCYNCYENTLPAFQAAIDAGADMVIGAHSHCLQGMEVYNGKLITYSLGNFIFNGRYNKTMALKATVEEDNSIKAQFIPCESSSYQTYISEGDKAKEIMDYYKSISFDINMDEEGYIQIN